MDNLTDLERQVIEVIKASLRERTLTDLATACGVHRTQLSKFMNGRAGLTSGSLGKVVDYLGFRLPPGPGTTPQPAPLAVEQRYAPQPKDVQISGIQTGRYGVVKKVEVADKP